MAKAKKKRSAPKRRRKKRTSTLSAAPVRRRRRPSPRRRKRTLSSGGGGGSKKVTWMKAIAGSGAGALGGAVYVAPKFFIKLPTWGKALYGVGSSVLANKMGATNVGAGIAGATVMDMANTFFGVTLKDDLEDYEYVDPSTLSDTGFEDEDGNAVGMDDNGVVYALNDNGDYVPIGTADDFDLGDEYMEDDYDLGANNIQNASMLPLSDAYQLSQASGWGGY